MSSTYERHLEMFEHVLKTAGLIVTTISTVVKIVDLTQQWRDKRASKKQPRLPE